jgi:DNA-binding beta-propeller fold protein YncE
MRPRISDRQDRVTRRLTLWLLLALIGLGVLAIYQRPKAPVAHTLIGPAPTPFGWAARLTLLAGDGVAGLRDGPGAQARFADPYGVAVSAAGRVYVADAGDNNRIRGIAPDGTVSTLAGGDEGFADGLGATARFNTPSGLALDAAGNLYVADTGNHAIRKVTPQGLVSTLAGDGVAGFRDGPAAQARFNGPIGVAVDGQGKVYVADTYNDRIRVIGTDGAVSTLAGGELPGFLDGRGADARFDTPVALAVDAQGTLWIADPRNHAIRKLAPDGTVSTFASTLPEDTEALLRRPLSIAVTHDGFLYVGESGRGRVLQYSPDGQVIALTGALALNERLLRPAGLAVDAAGAVYAVDAQSARVHKIIAQTTTPNVMTSAAARPITASGPAPDAPLPQTLARWPVAPQNGWHEVTGTLGEVRGNDKGDSRDHLHDGLDIHAEVGAQVLAIADGKVSSPLSTWRFGELSEGLALDTLDYIHMRVGRTPQGVVLDPSRFLLLRDAAGKPERVRVRRGTRFKAGEPLGTINAFSHVHLSLDGNDAQRNAVALGFVDFTDHVAPHIEGMQLFDAAGQLLDKKQKGRLLVPRDAAGVQIVVDAWDQVDGNLPRRRLGLYALGYQVLHADGSALPGFETPRMNIAFNRMPLDEHAAKIAYDARSGETVHGSAVTRFRYVVTNLVRDGLSQIGSWPTDALPPGDYTLRITALDYAGNRAMHGDELALTLQ